MISKLERFRLKQEFPEGIPGWMWERGYDVAKVRTLMQGRRQLYTPDGSEHDFTGTVEQWDERVFMNASHFTVAVGRSPYNRVVTEYKTFPEARIVAETNIHAMVYAVTKSGRSTMLRRALWNRFDQLWKQKHESVEGQS